MPATARSYSIAQLPTLVHVEPNIVEYLYLAEIVARKFYRGRDPIRDTEFFSIACQELVRCGQKYDPSIGPFDRFAMRAMRNGIIQDARQRKAKKRIVEFEKFSDTIQVAEKSEKDEEHIQDLLEMLPSCLRGLPENDRKLVELIYIENKPVAEVADHLNVTRVTIYNRLDRVLTKLREGLLNVHDEG